MTSRWPRVRRAVRPKPSPNARPREHRSLELHENRGTNHSAGGHRADFGAGGLPRPAGREPSGRGAATRSARPHPQAGNSRSNVRVDAPRPRAWQDRPPRASHYVAVQRSPSRARLRHVLRMAQAPPQTLIFHGKTRRLSGGRHTVAYVLLKQISHSCKRKIAVHASEGT